VAQVVLGALAMSGPPVRPDADCRARVEAALAALYGADGLKALRVAVAPSPLSMLIGLGLADALVRIHEHAKVQRPLAPGLSPRNTAQAVWCTGTWPDDAHGDRGGRAAEDIRTAAREALEKLLHTLTPGGAGEQRDAPALPIYGAAAAVALHVVYDLTPSRVDAMTLHDAVAWVATAAGVDAGHLSNAFGAILQEMIGPRDWRTPLDRPFVLWRERDRLGTTGPRREEFKDRGTCAGHMTDFIAHGQICIVAARPDAVHVDEAGLLHCADGPSVRWPDGWTLYDWHGLRLTHDYEFIITRPEFITPHRIEAMYDVEFRRVMLEIYGMGRFVVDSGASVMNELPPDHHIVGLRGARLFSKQLAFDTEPLVFVELVNSTPEPDGTCRRYMLRVDPRAYGGLAEYLCHAAAASTWRRANGRLAYADFADYRPAAES
jgi:hypothetical protein